MHLKRLQLRHFRNLGIQDLEFPPEGVAIVGDNAQGKSNLLEAIYFLETFRSFRGARDDQLVEFGEDVFRLVGVLAGSNEAARGGQEPDASRDPEPDPPTPEGMASSMRDTGEAVDSTEVAAAFQKSGRRKKVTIDGVEVDRIGGALGYLGAVIFSPADIAVVAEGPSERRRFLDIVLSLNARGYLESLQRFRHILSQRNAALREEEPEAVVRAWDEALVRDGGKVMAERRRWIEGWCDRFREYYRIVSGGKTARMEYHPSIDPGSARTAQEVTDVYRDALDETAERERRVGNTVVGPHRDEVVFTVEGRDDGLDVRDFGSGGQKRTTALALRLVEADTIRQERGHAPLVLLDDVFAELDSGRGERILELLQRPEMGQVFLTAPKESDVRLRKDRLLRLGIQDGRVYAR
ncbi:MAG: DNA replication/repair protein RecF [Gemmatimonadota bacterium]